MDNLHIYNHARTVPQEALKPIQAGRLKGKSDINPMWRIKQLTELFGPCGFGWKYTITKQWLEPGGNEEISAFVNIELYIKHNGEWSEAIPGTGGSTFVAKEKNGLYTSDECFKMALTDAISVACKALGFGADVYWNADATKYNNRNNGGTTGAAMDGKGWADFWKNVGNMGYDEAQVYAKAGVSTKEELHKFTRTKAIELFNKLKAEVKQSA
jgi:hypothetical protein